MVEIVDEVLAISGVSDIPSTLAELIPCLVRVTVGVVVLSGVFRVIGKLTELFQYRNWRL